MLPTNSIMNTDKVNALQECDFQLKTSLVEGVIARKLFQDVN